MLKSCGMLSAVAVWLVACGSPDEAIDKGTAACQTVTCPGGTEEVKVAASSDCSGEVSGSTTGGKVSGKCIGTGECQVKCRPLQACCGGLTITPTTYDCETPCTADPCSCTDENGNGLCKPLDPVTCGGKDRCTCASGSLCDPASERCVSQCAGGQVACGATCCGSGDVCTAQNQCCNVAHACGVGGFECGHPCGVAHESCGTCANGTVCDEASFRCVAANECEPGQTACSITADGQKLGLILECEGGAYKSKGQACSDTHPDTPYCKVKAAKAVCVECATDAQCAAKGAGYRCQGDNTCAFVPTPCEPACVAPQVCNLATGQCEADGDDCVPNPCRNGGTCTDRVASFSCACAAGFEGPTCESETDECAPNPCQNGGTCTDGAGQFTCSCAAGFEGPTCETNTDDCAPNPCQNGGTCTDGVGSFTCTCADGFEGPTCVTNIDECVSDPCENGGTCVDGVASYTCTCAAGFEGPTCATNTDDCAPNPCQHSAPCTDGIASFTCACPPGLSGPTCNENCSAGWCFVFPGTFTMGSPPDEPCRKDHETAHPVTLTRAIYVGQTEVTQAAWSALVELNPSPVEKWCATCPVQTVTWYEALHYANLLSESEGRPACYTLVGCTGAPGTGMTCAHAASKGLDCTGYRLPTEAEWERVTRAGTNTAYWSGANTTCAGEEEVLNDVGWYVPNPAAGTFGFGPYPVAQLQPNNWGLHDVLGNVFEWVWDAWDGGDYALPAPPDPVGTKGAGRQLRGGSYDAEPELSRAAARSMGDPGETYGNVGFRLVRTAPGANGTACDDNDPCTDSDTWSNGTCQGVAKSCPGGACLGGACVAETTCKDGWCLIPAGSFTMGSPETEPCRNLDETQHSVTLTRAFWAGATEVTQAQWSALVPANPSFHSDCAACPVENVTWFEALHYANALSAAEGRTPCYLLTGCNKEPGTGVNTGMMCTAATFWGLDCTGYRLPTEAEWEYMARAGTSTAYWNGATDVPFGGGCQDQDPRLDFVGWYKSHPDGTGATQPVGLLLGNPWGLFDVHGNVAEWVWDGYSFAIPAGVDPTGSGVPEKGRRGGSFAAFALGCRSAARAALPSDERGSPLGFRLVRSVPAP